MISIVIPAYNESKTLYQNVHEVLKEVEGIDTEIVIVDDGSKDTTWSIITNLSKENNRIRGIKFSRNFGKEAAVIAGLTEARGDAVIPMDADLQDPPKYVKEMVRKWQEGYKVIETVSIRKYKESFFHKLCAESFYKVLQKMTKIDVMNARDFRLMDKQVVQEIINLGDKNLFFKGMANFVGFKKTTIQVETASREGDTTKYTFKMLLRLALDALTSFSVKPLMLPLKFGIFSMIMALVTIIVACVTKSAKVTLGAKFVLIALQFLMVSMILISLGIIGFYLGKMYEQVKGRPRYIVEERT